MLSETQLLLAQRDLALQLAETASLDRALPLCLRTALEVSEMDCGGVYLVERGGDLALATATGLSDGFMTAVARVAPDAERWREVMTGQPLYRNYAEESPRSLRVTPQRLIVAREGLRAVATIPILHQGRVIACFIIASHVRNEVPITCRDALETIALQVGNAIVRIQTQEELAASQQQFRALLDSVQDFVMVLGLDGGILYANDRVRDRLGYSINELHHASILSLHPPAMRGEAAQCVADMVAGQREICPLPLLTRDGRQIPVETKVAPGFWENQPALIGVSRDLSDRCQVEAALDDSESRNRAILNALPDLIFITDAAGTLLDYHSADHDDLLAIPEQFLGRSYHDFLPAPVARVFSEHFARVLQGQPAQVVEYTLLIHGETRYFEARIVAYSGNRLLTIVRNITARKQAEQSLRRREDYMRAMLDTFPYLVWLKDIEGRFQAVNTVFAQSCGRERVEDVLGWTDFDVWPRALAENYVADDQQVIAGGQKKMVEEMIADQGVTKWFETYKSPIRDREGQIIGTAGFARDVTERKTAEEELRRSRMQFMTVLDSMDAFVYVADMQTYELLFVNRKIKSLIGEAREGKRCWQTLQLDQEGPCDFCTNDHLLKADGKPTGTYTWEFYNPVAQRWLLCRDTAIQWLDGRYVRLEIATDISERKAMEEDLRDRIEFENLIASLSTRFINLNPDSLDVEIERALGRIGAFSRVDRSYVFLFNDDHTLMHNTHEWCAEGIEPQKALLQEVETALLPWWMSCLERRESIHIPSVAGLPPEAAAEKAILESQGIQSLVVAPLLSANHLLGFMGFDAVRAAKIWSLESVALLRMVGDIFANALERQRIDQELRWSEARNRGLLNAIPDLMFRLNRQGEILDFTWGHQQNPGLDRETLLGTSISCFLEALAFSALLEKIQQALATNATQSLECPWDFGQGPETGEIRLSVSGADEIIAIVRNVNERARLERMRTDFINDASHELRTPLTTIIMMVELLQGGGEEEETREYWRVLKSELDRARLLIEDLLTLGRLESGRLNIAVKPLNIAGVIEQALHSVRLMADSQAIELVVNLPERLPDVLGNAYALLQVFVNLLNNAVKFTPVQGCVAISAAVADGEVIVTVSDSGIGIPETELPRLFERFFRASNALEHDIPGSGMGLYIIKGIIEELGGGITVQSALNQGTTFILRLPLPGDCQRPGLSEQAFFSQ
jgi:PAS domain S-box-containing protein